MIELVFQNFFTTGLTTASVYSAVGNTQSTLRRKKRGNFLIFMTQETVYIDNVDYNCSRAITDILSAVVGIESKNYLDFLCADHDWRRI